MPTHLAKHFDVEELKTAELVKPFDFTKGAPVLKIRMNPKNSQTGQDGLRLGGCQTALFDLHNDPKQENPISVPDVEARLTAAIKGHFDRHDAPCELYEHFSLSRPDASREAPRNPQPKKGSPFHFDRRNP